MSRRNTYQRVIPRDFFNEAKLLKSLGRLSLSILDNLEDVGQYLEEELEGVSFDIEQTIDGDIYVDNHSVYISATQEKIELFSFLNSRLDYPLYFLNDYGDAEMVFKKSGKFTKEFLKYIRSRSDE